jgi:hypothetical protein
MKPAYCLVLIVVTLASCSSAPSKNTVQTAIAQTQTAQPTSTSIPTTTVLPTSTTIPLSSIDLESILLLPGDLPTDIIGGQIRSKPPTGLTSLPKADQVIQQGFRAGELASDGVTIFLYNSVSDLDAAYTQVAKIEEIGTAQAHYDIGERISIALKVFNPLPLIGGDGLPGGTSVKLVFSHCHALVYIDLFSESASEDVATTYAQRLDERLSELVCR